MSFHSKHFIKYNKGLLLPYVLGEVVKNDLMEFSGSWRGESFALTNARQAVSLSVTQQKRSNQMIAY